MKPVGVETLSIIVIAWHRQQASFKVQYLGDGDLNRITRRVWAVDKVPFPHDAPGLSKRRKREWCEDIRPEKQFRMITDLKRDIVSRE